MLVGIWRPTAGGVYLDGQSTFSHERGSVGRAAGYLPQEPTLFTATVAENIARFGEAEMAVIVAAARAAGIHDLVGSLPRGYATRIGSAGVQLSGGQKQRIALARALYGDPKLLVLDEPNSNLDAEGEPALVAAIQAAQARGTTVVVLAQRMSILNRAGRLLVLKDGAVAHFGPRAEVLETFAPRRVPERRPAVREIASRAPPAPGPSFGPTATSSSRPWSWRWGSSARCRAGACSPASTPPSSPTACSMPTANASRSSLSRAASSPSSWSAPATASPKARSSPASTPPRPARSSPSSTPSSPPPASPSGGSRRRRPPPPPTPPTPRASAPLKNAPSPSLLQQISAPEASGAGFGHDGSNAATTLRQPRIAAELALHDARLGAHASQVAALDRRIDQLRAESDASSARVRAADRQLALWEEERGQAAELVDSGAAPRQRLLEFDRAVAQAEGDRDEHAGLAEAARQDKLAVYVGVAVP